MQSAARTLVPCCALLLAASACSEGPTERNGSIATHFSVVSGDDQQATVGTELPQPIRVRATDDDGQIVAGAVVNFVVTLGGGSVFAPAVNTNAQGLASNRWTLGTTVGPQRIEVRAIDAGGEPVTYAVIDATATADVPASMSRVGTAGLTGIAGHPAAELLAVRVVDQFGNAVPGVTVTWTPSGGASVSPATSTTNGEGIATTQVTLPGTVGESRVTASVADLPELTLTGTVTAGAASRIEIVSGNEQTATVGTTLQTPLIVKVFDSHGNPVRDTPVTWSPASGSGAITDSDPATDDAGLAAATWTLGTQAGSMSVTVTALGSLSATFTALGLAGSPNALRIVSGNGQQGPESQPLSAPIVVEVRDDHGNPVPGASIRWIVSVGGGSVTPALSTTGENGQASATWTLGPAGANSVTAFAEGAGSVTFDASALSATGRSLIPGAGNGSSFVAGGSVPLTARLVTGAGEGIAGEAVSWRVTHPADATASGTIVSPTTSTTSATGHATVTLSGTRAGPVTVEASVEGLPPAVFQVTITPGMMRSMRPGAGYSQSAPAGSTISFKIRYYDAYGNPVASGPRGGKTTAMTAHWTPAQCGTFTATETDANLEATATWTLCYVPGFNSVEIRITPSQSDNPGLTITGTGPPTSIIVVNSIVSQDRSVERVVVTDDAGFIISNTPVTFTITSGSGTVRLPGATSGGSSLTVNTTPPGLATVEIHRSNLAQPITVTVSKAGYPDVILQR